MGKDLERVVSFRIDDETYQWLEQQGKVSDFCRRIVLEYRRDGSLSKQTMKTLRTILDSVQALDADAKQILAKLPE